MSDAKARALQIAKDEVSLLDGALADVDAATKYPESQKALELARVKWQAVLEALEE